MRGRKIVFFVERRDLRRVRAREIARKKVACGERAHAIVVAMQTYRNLGDLVLPEPFVRRRRRRDGVGLERGGKRARKADQGEKEETSRSERDAPHGAAADALV